MKKILLFLLSHVCLCATVSAGWGDSPLHNEMPPVPATPADFQNMWDPFALRQPGSGEVLELVPQTANVSMNVDIMSANARQIARDSNGNWWVLVNREHTDLFLATAPDTKDNPYRPRGGDFASLRLAGVESAGILSAQGEIQGGSLVIDRQDHLHVVWHDDKGVWHAMTDVSRGPAGLSRRDAWQVQLLTDAPAEPGDIMVDAEGIVRVAYSCDDNIYYQAVTDRSIELAAGVDAGMPELLRSGGRVRMEERESQDAVMDLGPDGSVWLAFRRDMAIWAVQRTPEGEWLPAERAAREYVFHPSIMVTADGWPLITFQHEGVRQIPLNTQGYLSARLGGGSALGYSKRTEEGWQLGTLAKAEEIPVYRRGIWGQRYQGEIISQIEQLGWPVLFRDGQGVTWAIWQNTTLRWVFSARWMGDGFGQTHEFRGPFNAPSLPVTAEKRAPAGASDVGVIFYAAKRVIFDRARIPSLSVTENREIFFLDSLEVSATSGVDFVLNQMEKPLSEPVLSPEGANNRIVRGARVNKHGDTYVMTYSRFPNDESQRAYAISSDGIHFEKVDRLPGNLPEADPVPTRLLETYTGAPGTRPPARFDNPDSTDFSKRFMRIRQIGGGRGSYWVEYSSNGNDWKQGSEVSAVTAMREQAKPSVWIANDPERPLRIYGRVYTETGRSWGVIWSKDLLHWGGLEHLLNPDDPYEESAALVKRDFIDYAMRGQPYIDSGPGKNEDEIYGSEVRYAHGLYFCYYWPGVPGRPLADVGLAVSRDGFNFTRVKNGERILPVGPPGSWDSGYIFQMSPMVDGDNLRFYYRGTTATREGSDVFNHNVTEVGLAIIRANGWSYYTPSHGVKSGSITTIPIQSPGNARRGLTVNVEGVEGHADAFAVEVLDAKTGESLPGFSLKDCLPVSNDGLAVQVKWRGGETLPSGRDIRLRFHLNTPGVRLYTFGFN